MPNHVRELWQFFEVCTPTGLTMDCKLFSTDEGLELRLQSWSRRAERVQTVGTYREAQQIAEQWLKEVTGQDREPFRDKTVHGWRAKE